ncbi:unnamed protein product [Adineta ricciae]|uniref:Uncharacterized protein n=1 Tax=Adineta ricciae TaxID=249248 RepID=A0A814YIK3_ADIRI|nr:unnamed protein product [Adineta ricciae]
MPVFVTIKSCRINSQQRELSSKCVQMSQFRTQRRLRTRFNNLQRDLQRELLRDTPDDLNQEIQWLWSDIRRYIDEHIYYGMGFTLAFLMGLSLLPKRYR